MNQNNSKLFILLQKKFNEGLYNEIEELIKNDPKLLDNENYIFLYGLSLLKIKKFSAAQLEFEKLISLNEKNIEAYFQLGISLRAQNKNNQAIKVLNQSIKISPNKIILLLLANLYRDLGLFSDAKLSIKRCLELSPDFNEAKLALANIYTDQGSFDKAKNSIQQLIEQNNEQALTTYSYILLEEGSYDLAEKVLKKSLKLYRSNNNIKFNLAIIMLSQKKFSEGWAYYESRFDLNKYNLSKQILNSITKPRWSMGKSTKKIMIWGEQGVGDQILFSNLIDSILDNFEKIILCVTEKLIPFLKGFYPGVEILSLKDLNTFKDFDYHIPMSSLGLYFQDQLTIIPNKKNILFHSKNIPKKIQRIRCGISWISNSGITSNKKSIDLELFQNFFSMPNIEFVNLQYSDETSSINKLEKKMNKKIFIDHSIDCLNNIYELASLMQSCDFVVTVSNSNAHIAGKLGIKTFLLLPQHAGKFWYWHNTTQSNKSLWYPSIEFIKQEISTDWDDVINKLINKIAYFS